MITRNCSVVIDDLSLAIALDPDFADVIFRQGAAYYFGEKDNDKAITDITSSMCTECVPACEMLK